MRSDIVIGGLLLAVVGLATGASLEGVQQARSWQRRGDIARANQQWDAAYAFYTRAAETFPGTPHGRVARARAREARAYLLRPQRPSSNETPASWVGELIDFLTWP